MNNKGKTLYITGASSGIGAAIAALFTRHGYDVFNFDVTVGECGHQIPVDVTRHDELCQQVASIAASCPPTVVICNAGKHLSASLENTTESQFTSMFDVNVKGAFTFCQATLPYLKKINSGRIILVGSDQSTIAKPNSFAYCMSKHALAAMAKSIALDFAADGITANVICPGTIDTPLYRNAIQAYSERSGISLSDIEEDEAAEQPVNRIGRSDEVAHLALFLASEHAGYINGSLQMIDGGYTAK